MLAEQQFHIRLIVDHEDKKVHRSAPGAGVTASGLTLYLTTTGCHCGSNSVGKLFRPLGTATLMPTGVALIKMVSGCDCLDPGRNDIDDGGGEQDGDDNYRQCSAHCSPLFLSL